MPGNTSNGQKRAAHGRWHLGQGVVNPDCKFCCLEHPEIAGMPLLPGQKTRRYRMLNGPTFQPIRAHSMSERGASLQEAAKTLDMPTEQFEKDFKEAFGITWNEYAGGARNRLYDDVDAKIWERARAGDATFVKDSPYLRETPGLPRSSYQRFTTCFYPTGGTPCKCRRGFVQAFHPTTK